MPEVCVSGAFDDIRSRDVRFLQEASRLGELTVLLWTDEDIHKLAGCPPKFPETERRYILESIRYVSRVEAACQPIERERLPRVESAWPAAWVVSEAEDLLSKRDFCRSVGMDHYVIPESRLAGFPPPDGPETAPAGKKVIVTGCYDWLHSGHIRFFEQASAYGDLYVSLGNDANIRGLKGDGHPMLSQEERTYMVGSIRFVKRAFVAAGFGWLDADEEIHQLKPDFYLVNEDGDRPEKQAFCEKLGMQYVVLKRLPKDGLPGRQSTQLRGF
jgi:cytidyltransferase-like protein